MKYAANHTLCIVRETRLIIIPQEEQPEASKFTKAMRSVLLGSYQH